MNLARAAVLAVLLAGPVSRAGEPSLPTPLELKYVLRYGGVVVGHATKSLARDGQGNYVHRSRSIPEGPLRIFTRVEWMEEGQFEVRSGSVRPLNFLEFRVGADKPHRHSATFDWTARLIRYEGWPDVPLPDGTQDQGSLLYAWMLNPPSSSGSRQLHISTGKKLRLYQYREIGTEMLDTVLGRVKTRIIERRPLATDKDRETFRVWLAIGAYNLPVRISTEKRGQDTVLNLEAVRGLPTGGNLPPKTMKTVP